MSKFITHLKNIEYLTGFKGSHGLLLVGKKNLFFTDSRYKNLAKELEKSKQRLRFQFRLYDENFIKEIKKTLGKQKMIEFEAEDISVKDLENWKKRLKGIRFIPIKNPIENLRLFKDPQEIHFLIKSQEINEKTLQRTKKLLKKGVSELELAWQIKMIGHELGAEDISFEPIVAFGPHSATPHHQNTNRRLKKGDVILIDMGMKYKSYCSDMTRCFFFGKPSQKKAEVYEKVLAAQNAAIQKIKNGVKAKTIDQIARKTLGDFEPHFTHSLGHGIGLDVHEAPRLSQKSPDVLKKGMVVTVEPGVYLDGEFGIRIEDMGLVTEKGYENFTKAPKDLHSAILRPIARERGA